MQPIYIDRTSPLHALHPLTKIAGAGLLLVATYALPGQFTPLMIFGLCWRWRSSRAWRAHYYTAC